ncbi:hypothetical protein V6N12_068454 [Hibiscus sabdariffa]|uniref:Uncharacterized protein n=1 Tax=Hibiscus sabdariffa TaxID=183260 RepID=A0ABR2FQ68_9ROSI
MRRPVFLTRLNGHWNGIGTTTVGALMNGVSDLQEGRNLFFVCREEEKNERTEAFPLVGIDPDPNQLQSGGLNLTQARPRSQDRALDLAGDQTQRGVGPQALHHLNPIYLYILLDDI